MKMIVVRHPYPACILNAGDPARAIREIDLMRTFAEHGYRIHQEPRRVFRPIDVKRGESDGQRI